MPAPPMAAEAAHRQTMHLVPPSPSAATAASYAVLSRTSPVQYSTRHGRADDELAATPQLPAAHGAGDAHVGRCYSTENNTSGFLQDVGNGRLPWKARSWISRSSADSSHGARTWTAIRCRPLPMLAAGPRLVIPNRSAGSARDFGLAGNIGAGRAEPRLSPSPEGPCSGEYPAGHNSGRAVGDSQSRHPMESSPTHTHLIAGGQLRVS